ALRKVAAPGFESRPDGEQGKADGNDMRHGGGADAGIVAHLRKASGIPPDHGGDGEEDGGDDQRRPVGAAPFVGGDPAHLTSPMSLRMLSVAATSFSSCSLKASPAR